MMFLTRKQLWRYQMLLSHNNDNRCNPSSPHGITELKLDRAASSDILSDIDDLPMSNSRSRDSLASCQSQETLEKQSDKIDNHKNNSNKCSESNQSHLKSCLKKSNHSRRRNKSIVTFSNRVKVILIPCRIDYVNHGVDKLIWWNCDDIDSFKEDAVNEITELMKSNDMITTKMAIQILYHGASEH